MKKECTVFTDEVMMGCASMLKEVSEACMECVTEGISFRQACHKRNLNPENTRNILLRLNRCRNEKVFIEELPTYNIYDNYERFYQAVFGDMAMTEAQFPVDYRQSVDHVLKNTGLTDKESVILMRSFGIGDYEEQEALSEIAESMRITVTKAKKIEADALSRCRHNNDRILVLKIGLASYTMRQDQKKEYHEKQMAHYKQEYEALMAKQEKEHGDRMAAIALGVYGHIIKKFLSGSMSKDLSRTSVGILKLSARPLNAIMRNGTGNMLDLLELVCTGKFMELQNMGAASAEEVTDRMETYFKDVYGLSISDAYEICFVKVTGSEKEREK